MKMKKNDESAVIISFKVASVLIHLQVLQRVASSENQSVIERYKRILQKQST